MATLVRDNPYHERRVAERRRIAYPATARTGGMRVSWGGVFGGVLVALGFLLLTTALGVAVGISAASVVQSQGAPDVPASEVQATRAAWITFGALLLSLAAAVVGAMGGRRNPAREAKA